jgi:hypothetical protein
MRKLTCSYLYTDGTLVAYYDEFRKDAKIGETVDVTLGYCTLNLAAYAMDGDGSGSVYAGKRKVTGRIVFHSWNDDAVISLAKGGTINATLPSLTAGSNRSREMGLKVQYVELKTKNGMRLNWTDTECVSSQFCLQEMAIEHEGKTLTPGSRWGYSATVYAVRDLRKLAA